MQLIHISYIYSTGSDCGNTEQFSSGKTFICTFSSVVSQRPFSSGIYIKVKLDRI
uniref:Uncharacterized protein n=1 Tax=Anguilla anguilla TaxID=7936 RepID=A0A0E9XQY5_ANGAN